MLPGRRPDAKFVAVRIGELRPFAPGLRGQLYGNVDSPRFERRAGFFDIAGMQHVAGETRPVGSALAAQPKHDMGLRSWRSYFDPAFCFAHGLVVDLFKAECVDVEVERLILVADTYGDGADFCEHRYLLFVHHFFPASMITDKEQNFKLPEYFCARHRYRPDESIDQ